MGFLGAHIIACGLAIVFFFVLIAMMIPSPSSRVPELASNSVLRIDLADLREIVTTDDWMQYLPGKKGSQPVSLTQAIEGIRRAKASDKIKGIYLNVESLNAGLASIDELRTALQDFKKSGKFVYAYGDSYDQRAYYLATAADKIYINPEGSVSLVGLASSTVMMRQALDKLGIKAEVFKVGTYKGAVEPYILDQRSEPNKEQTRVYLEGVWEHMLQGIASARRISVESLQTFASMGRAFDEARELLRYRLVDSLVFRLDMEDIISRLVGVKSPKALHQVSLADLVAQPDERRPLRDAPEITVLYAEGDIMSGSSYGEGIGEQLAEDLKRVAEEGKAKALVLRINSPGGSAFLSEAIWHEMRRLKKKMPVVVSMGDLAASGGYYVASAADAIVASPMTLTGSIGIFGIIPDASALAQRLGLSMDVVKTSPYAGVLDASFFGFQLQGLSPEARSAVQRMVERGYRTFLSRVSEGRDMPIDSVDKVGQGRVWLGSKAKELGLVDELGGLDTAIQLAAKLAGISKNYRMNYGETSRSLWDQLFSSETSDSFVARLRAKFMTEEERRVSLLMRQLTTYSGIQARLPYGTTPY
nr:signal peptide peptidase SppA [uncultured Porphyromonas sp.]